MPNHTLSNGITVKEKSVNPSGYAGSSTSSRTIDTSKPYRAAGVRALAAAVDPRVSDFQTTNQNIQIGYYSDPREAAYVSALFNAKPELFMDDWNYRNNIKFPQDLYDLPRRSDEKIKQLTLEKENRTRDREHTGQGVTHREPVQNFDNIEWRAFIQNHGIKGGQLLSNLPHSNADERTQSVQFISNLQRMNAGAAINALKQKGLDLLDPIILKKIQQSEVLSENNSLNESIQTLNRLKMLAGLKK